VSFCLVISSLLFSSLPIAGFIFQTEGAGTLQIGKKYSSTPEGKASRYETIISFVQLSVWFCLLSRYVHGSLGAFAGLVRGVQIQFASNSICVWRVLCDFGSHESRRVSASV
jgi:hypothetical protein